MYIKEKHFFRIYALIFFIFCISILLFSRELGLYRGILGDICIIGFLFSVVKSYCVIESKYLLGGILSIAFVLEGLQYIEILKRFPWIDTPIISILLGSTYDPLDFVWYSIGGIIILLFERISREKK